MARYNMAFKSEAPFMYVEKHERRGAVGVIAFGAYNASGLIGPEKGGVALVRDSAQKAVIATRDIPSSQEARAKVTKELLQARTEAGVIRKAVKLGGFDWRTDPERLILALVQ